MNYRFGGTIESFMLSREKGLHVHGRLPRYSAIYFHRVQYDPGTAGRMTQGEAAGFDPADGIVFRAQIHDAPVITTGFFGFADDDTERVHVKFEEAIL